MPTVNVHHGSIHCMQFSPFNPNLLITGSEDSKLSLNTLDDFSTLTETKTTGDVYCEGHTKKVTHVDWCNQSEAVVASGGFDEVVKVKTLF